MPLRFGQIELDLDAFEVRRAGQHLHVEPQVFEVVRYLVEHRDRMVPKEELLEQVWGTRFVSESALTSRIKAARRALGDDGREQRIIRTVHGRGYRFVAPLDADEDTEADATRACGGLVPGAFSSAKGRSACSRRQRPTPRRGAGGWCSCSAKPGSGRPRWCGRSSPPTLACGYSSARARRPRDTAAPRPLARHRGRVTPGLGRGLDSPAAGQVQRALLAELGESPSDGAGRRRPPLG